MEKKNSSAESKTWMYLAFYKETKYEWKYVTYKYTANQKDIKVTWCFGIFHTMDTIGKCIMALVLVEFISCKRLFFLVFLL